MLKWDGRAYVWIYTVKVLVDTLELETRFPLTRGVTLVGAVRSQPSGTNCFYCHWVRCVRWCIPGGSGLMGVTLWLSRVWLQNRPHRLGPQSQPSSRRWLLTEWPELPSDWLSSTALNGEKEKIGNLFPLRIICEKQQSMVFCLSFSQYPRFLKPLTVNQNILNN